MIGIFNRLEIIISSKKDCMLFFKVKIIQVFYHLRFLNILTLENQQFVSGNNYNEIQEILREYKNSIFLKTYDEVKNFFSNI